MSRRIEYLLADFGTDALVVTRDGEIILEYGNINDLFNVASIRKSLLSALYGIRVAEEKLSNVVDRDGVKVTRRTAGPRAR